MSTRRFVARLSSFVLGTSGLNSARPAAASRDGSMPAVFRTSRTARARAVDRSQLSAKNGPLGAMSSVLPSIRIRFG
jgi:hypothetical protein